MNDLETNSPVMLATRQATCAPVVGDLAGLSIIQENADGSQETKQLIDAHGVVVPAERLVEFRAYARKLKKKFPHMKPARLQRKVAEYFKLNIV